MEIFFVVLELTILTLLLWYDHKFMQIPNRFLILLFCVIIAKLIIDLQSVAWNGVVFMCFVSLAAYAIGAIGAGDGKFLIIMSFRFDLFENMAVLISCILVGCMIGAVKILKSKSNYQFRSILYNRTTFPFLYACYPVIVFFILIREV